VNRWVQLSGTYDYTGQRGAATTALPISGDYTRSLALVTLRLAL
jgi:hypothetical protein